MSHPSQTARTMTLDEIQKELVRLRLGQLFRPQYDRDSERFRSEHVMLMKSTDGFMIRPHVEDDAPQRDWHIRQIVQALQTAFAGVANVVIDAENVGTIRALAG